MLLHIGYGNYVNFNEIKNITSVFKKGYISKIIFSHKLINQNKLIDCANGNPKKCVVLLKDNTCVYSGIQETTLIKRWKEKKENKIKNISDLLHVGKDNYVELENIKLISGNTKAKPLVAKIKEAKLNNNFIDFTNGEKMRSILFMKDDTIIVTALDEYTMINRIEKIKNNTINQL